MPVPWGRRPWAAPGARTRRASSCRRCPLPLHGAAEGARGGSCTGDGAAAGDPQGGGGGETAAGKGGGGAEDAEGCG